MLETLAVAVPIVVAVLVVVLYRSPLAAAGLVLTMAVAKAWFVELPGIEAGVMVYPGDVVGLLLAIAASLRITLKGALRVPPSAIIFTTMLMLSFVMGLAEFGRSAGVDFRVIFTFTAGMFYFSSVPTNPALIVRLMRIWVVAGCTLVLIAWFVWIADATGLAMAKKWIDADPTGVKFRVLNASTAYLIGVGSVILLHLLMSRQIATGWWPIFVALGGTVLILQHRSVWVATFVSALPVVILAERGRTRVLWLGLAVGLIAIALMPFMSQRLSGVSESVSLQAERAADMTKGTSGGRVRAWEQLLKDWQTLGLGRQLIGKPFGSSYGGLANAPHNCYLQVMYRTGYIGLVCMLAMYGSTVIRLFGRRRGMPEGAGGVEALLFALILGQLTFFIPYAFTAEQGVLLGAGMAYARRKLLRENRVEYELEDHFGISAAPADTIDLYQNRPL